MDRTEDLLNPKGKHTAWSTFTQYIRESTHQFYGGDQITNPERLTQKIDNSENVLINVIWKKMMINIEWSLHPIEEGPYTIDKIASK